MLTSEKHGTKLWSYPKAAFKKESENGVQIVVCKHHSAVEHTYIVLDFIIHIFYCTESNSD